MDGHKRVADVIIGDEGWVPLHGIASKRTNKEWLDQNDQRHRICKLRFQVRKRIFTIFLNHKGPLAVDDLFGNSIIIGSYYAETVLPKVVQPSPPRTSSFSATVPVTTNKGTNSVS